MLHFSKRGENWLYSNSTALLSPFFAPKRASRNAPILVFLHFFTDFLASVATVCTYGVLFDTQFGSRFGHRKLVHIQRDHKINVVDAYLIRCHAAQLKILDGPQQLAADVNRDGRINVVDAYLVRCYAAQLINEFPAA